MNDMARWSAAQRPPSEGGRWPARGGDSALDAIFGGAATALVILVGFALALVFAATLAVVLVLAVGLFGLAALALRVRPRPALARPGRAGHAWVTYRWDDR